MLWSDVQFVNVLPCMTSTEGNDTSTRFEQSSNAAFSTYVTFGALTLSSYAQFMNALLYIVVAFGRVIERTLIPPL